MTHEECDIGYISLSTFSDAVWRRDQMTRCITMAMGCLDPHSKNPDERLAWYRLLDALDGKEPRAALAPGQKK